MDSGKNSEKKLRIFQSFEDGNTSEIRDVLRQPPLERIRETVQLILRVYGVTEEQLNKERKKFQLKIIRNE